MHTLALVAVLLTATPSGDAVDEAIAVAQAQAAAGEFDAAIATVRDARRVGDHRDLVFVEAQLLRLSGACDEAVARYDEFLSMDPPSEDRAEAEAARTACEPEPTPEPAPVPAPAPAPMPVPQPTPPPIDRAPPKKTDVLGIGLWTTGGIVLATGIGLYAGAWGLRGNARREAPDLDAYLAREQRARVLSGVGIAAISIGAAVLIAAAVRHGIRARRRKQGHRTAVISWPPRP